MEDEKLNEAQCDSNDIISDISIMVGAILFILLSSVDPKYPGGKRGRKAILKDLKRVLMTYAHNENKKHYLDLVARGDKCQHDVRDTMVAEYGDKGNYINPGALLMILYKRYPDYIKPYNLRYDHINNINNHYIDAGISFHSIKYGNRLIQAIHEELQIPLELKEVTY